MRRRIAGEIGANRRRFAGEPPAIKTLFEKNRRRFAGEIRVIIAGNIGVQMRGRIAGEIGVKIALG